jgi:MHS family proline/betaine transporter-like MFS transporter
MRVPNILSFGSLDSFVTAYELFVYVFLSMTLGRLFFVESSPTLALSYVLALFAISYLIRFFGIGFNRYLARKYGEKVVFNLSIGLSLSTILIGLLPTYHDIGFTATILFIVFKIIQGYFVERIPSEMHTLPMRNGYYSLLKIASSTGALAFCSSICAFIFLVFPQETVDTWVWRIPFLISAIYTLWLATQRKQLDRPNVMDSEDSSIDSPVSWVNGLIGTIIAVAAVSTLYTLTLYMPLYLINTLGYKAGPIYLMQAISLLLNTGIFYIYANYFNMFAPKTMTSVATVLLVLLAYPLFLSIQDSSEMALFASLFTLQFLTTIISKTVITGDLLYDLFKGHEYTQYYNKVQYQVLLIATLLGSITPLAMVYAINRTDYLMLPAIYIMGLGIFSLFALLFYPKIEKLSESMPQFAKMAKETIFASAKKGAEAIQTNAKKAAKEASSIQNDVKKTAIDQKKKIMRSAPSPKGK